MCLNNGHRHKQCTNYDAKPQEQWTDHNKLQHQGFKRQKTSCFCLVFCSTGTVTFNFTSLLLLWTIFCDNLSSLIHKINAVLSQRVFFFPHQRIFFLFHLDESKIFQHAISLYPLFHVCVITFFCHRFGEKIWQKSLWSSDDVSKRGLDACHHFFLSRLSLLNYVLRWAVSL